MALKRVNYQDESGRWKVVLLPEDESEENAERGVPVGPPSIEELGLPQEIEIALNNELFHRGILTSSEAIKRRPEVLASIVSALKLSTERVIVAYAGKDYRSASKESTKEQPNKIVPNRRPRQSRK